MALHRSELDRMPCSNPECTADACDEPLAFHSNCHPDSPTWASYSGQTGLLTIVCAECQKHICDVAVAA